MMSRIALSLVLIAAIVAVGFAIGCGGGDTGGTAEIIRPTWIAAQVEGDIVSIPTSDADSGKMLHFDVPYQDASMAFMAYKLDGQIYVRANVCPPCWSVGFNLQGDTLVCESCGTKFAAETGIGIGGACRNYPKAEVTYTFSGDEVAMDMDDLVTAYEDTKEPGGGDTGGTAEIIRPTWIAAQVEGDIVSIPTSDADSGEMLHFDVPYQEASMGFMAYKLGEEIYVRATACPPCQSVGFDLQGDILVCKGCGTRFEAKTGEGTSGTGKCRDYPKAEVPYTISGEKITMGMDDLATAHEETKEPICPTCP